MKLNRKAYIIIFIFLSFFLLFLKYSIDRNNMRKQIDQLLKSSESRLLDSSNFKHTVFTPVLDIKINTTENFVYCSSFQNAWKNFRSDVFKDTLKISAADSAEIIMKLEETLSQKATLDDEYNVSLAGRGRDGIVSKINAELVKKFKTNHFDAEIKTDEVLIYSRLKKTYELEYLLDEFLDHDFYLMNPTGGRTYLKSYGIQDNIIGDRNCEIKKSQIESLYCKDFIFSGRTVNNDDPYCYPDGLIMRFKLKGCDDELIIATDFKGRINEYSTLLNMYFMADDLISNKKFNQFNLKVFYDNNYLNEEFFGPKFDGFSQKVKKIKIEDLRSDTKQEFLEKFREKAALNEIEFKMLCQYINAMDEKINRYLNPWRRAFSLKIPKLKMNFSIKYPLFNDIIGHKYKFIHEIDAQFKFSKVPDELLRYDYWLPVSPPFVVVNMLHIKKKNAKLPYLMAYINNPEIVLKDNRLPELKTTPGNLIYINDKPVIYYKILNKDEFIDRD